ncbi:zinc-dependent metalloprotease [Nesterenkonia flava]|uniref:Zinc-dependent metalloprotease n=1 Tax=Nesterenkonia flava TaxID=469799 RepID=A0ABU1FQB7_9MICC|nr:zinc-dependent metalloprotease [Nesterenkonia flava]MDR5710836.1 zinc-dependent metalloprotease [Nesterenkonia flava]
MSQNSDDSRSGENREGPDEEFLRKLFGEAFGQDEQKDAEDSGDKPEDQKKDSGPSIGFTGTPRPGGSDSGQQSGGFPGFPPGFDPSQMLGGLGADPGMMQQIMGQVQAMFSAMQNDDDASAVNWDVTMSSALAAVQEDDPAVTPADQHRIDSALRLAEMWLNEATTFESLGQIGQGYTRRKWIEQTFEAWQSLTEPVGESVARAMGAVIREQLEDGEGAGIPEELKGMLPPQAMGQMFTMMERMAGVGFGAQIGQAIGELAREVHSSSDIGLPLAGDTLALLPANIEAFSKDLQVEDEEILLFLALREAARIRLFVHAPWLRDDLFNAVAQYAADVHVNMDRIEEAARQIDPQNPESMEMIFGEGLFSDPTPMQQAALRRIETTLALVEGWVDDVVSQAASHLPSLEKLRETMNRRRASGGPAEHTFATLVGLELRPRRLRDAAALWAHLRGERGIEGRDEVWAHPDVQPEEQDLDDPQGFFDRRAEREAQASKMDEELKKLLDGDYGSTDDGGTEQTP